MEPRLSLITLGVTDLARMRAFYTRLGFPLMPQSNDSVAFFGLKSIWLGLYPREALADDAKVDAAGSGFRGFTLAHNVRTREEVTLLLEAAEEAGGKIVKPAQDVFWGGHSGYFSDPEGFLWEVAWNPHFWIE